ncbi:MAG: GNAT family N-acetyltransferase [Anaerolineae bacterium]
MSKAPFLDRPHLRYQESFIVASREFEREGQPPRWSFSALRAHFDEYVETLLKNETEPMAGYVPQTTYWLIVDEQYAGTIDIRHKLTPALERFGGHIGYRIRPSMRQKGYGTLQLRLCLPKVWALGIDRALITCDDDNIGSRRIIEANGGVLQDKIDNGRGSLTRRYWITHAQA